MGVGPGPASARWAQAAAAVLMFAAGMAVSQVRMNYSDGALTVRVRPAESQPRAQVASVSTDIFLPAQSTGPVSNDNVGVQNAASPIASPIDTEQLLQRVRAMIDQSEQRQQRELALRISQVATEERHAAPSRSAAYSTEPRVSSRTSS